MRLAEIARSFCAVHRTATGKSVAFLKIAGEMAEWLKAHAWKACLLERVTWVRIPLSPPRSLDCREFTRLFFTKSPKHAHFPQFLLGKSDRRERTDLHAASRYWRFFSGDKMRSPTSANASGEAFAIKDRMLCEPDLTSSPIERGGQTFAASEAPRSMSVIAC